MCLLRPLIGAHVHAQEEGHLVKDRCEPCHITHVLQVIAAARGEDEATVAAAATRNSERLFFSRPQQQNA